MRTFGGFRLGDEKFFGEVRGDKVFRLTSAPWLGGEETGGGGVRLAFCAGTGRAGAASGVSCRGMVRKSAMAVATAITPSNIIERRVMFVPPVRGTLFHGACRACPLWEAAPEACESTIRRRVQRGFQTKE